MYSLKKSWVAGLTLATAFLSSFAWADDTSPAGLWKNIDDATGKPRALIRIGESNGALQGKIEKVFPGPNESQNPKCDKCDGANKDALTAHLAAIFGGAGNQISIRSQASCGEMTKYG